MVGRGESRRTGGGGRQRVDPGGKGGAVTRAAAGVEYIKANREEREREGKDGRRREKPDMKSGCDGGRAGEGWRAGCQKRLPKAGKIPERGNQIWDASGAGRAFLDEKGARRVG